MTFEPGSGLWIAAIVIVNGAIVAGCQYIGHRAAARGVKCPPRYTPKVTLAVEQRIYARGRNCGRKLRALKKKLLYITGGNA